MMNTDLLKYGALTTKIHAMEGKMLSNDDYKALSQLRNVSEAVSYIKTRTAYGRNIPSMVEEIHRETLEKLLRRGLFDDYKKVVKYLKDSDTEFLHGIMKRYEIKILKSAIRCLMSKGNTFDSTISELSESLTGIMPFDVEKIKMATSLSTIIEALDGSPYQTVLTALYSRGRNPTLFEIETNFDIYYFSELWKLADKCYKGKRAKEIKVAVGTEADMLNVLWIYRCKKYYKLSNEHIYALLLPVHHDLTLKKTQEFVEARDFTQFIEIIKDTKYYNAICDDSYTMYEKKLLKSIINIFKKTSSKNPYTIDTVVKYIYLKELELENVCSVIEGVRYGLGSEQIMGYVV